jgi:hypothetical protein
MPAYTVAPRVPVARPHVSPPGRLVGSMLSEEVPCTLVTWYLGLIPHWTNAGPALRTQLLLRTHQWIVERILAPEASLAAAAADLRPGGRLTRMLIDMVPAAEDSEERRHFIWVLVANLRHALLRPVTRRNEAWVRWLFLIPYSVKGWDRPAGGEAPARAVWPEEASDGSRHDDAGAVTGHGGVGETSG